MTVSVGLKEVLHVNRLRIETGDRISVTGDNGSGKTLLLKTLIREIQQSSGVSPNIGGDTSVVYIDQQYDLVQRDLSVYENLEQSLSQVSHEEVYKQMGRFQFPVYYAHKKAKELSGGEMARLAFAIATTAPLDLLILDEPTNNLDIATMDIISEALKNFTGAILVVSHDEVFLNRLNIKQNYKVESGQLVAL